MRIALLDSGIGGITVLKEALNEMPQNDYIYYADTLNVPYGTKDKSQVKEILLKAVAFISELNIDALVIACNTATSIAADELRRIYSYPIIGMEPAVKPALKLCTGSSRVLVFATPLALKEDKFKKLIETVDEDGKVDYLPLPELVDMAESFDFSEETFFNYIQNKLAGYDLNKYGAVVLGCTHFVLYRELFRKFLPTHVNVVDGNKGTVAHLKHVLEGLQGSGGAGKGEIEFYTSGFPMEEGYKRRVIKCLMKL